jgi:hypothetical protein
MSKVTALPNVPEFRNESGLDFTDITSEQWREYRWLDGTTFRVIQPLCLNVSEQGGHRIYDSLGVCHYIPPGWIHLCWVPKKGQPHFVK